MHEQGERFFSKSTLFGLLGVFRSACPERSRAKKVPEIQCCYGLHQPVASTEPGKHSARLCSVFLCGIFCNHSVIRQFYCMCFCPWGVQRLGGNIWWQQYADEKLL